MSLVAPPFVDTGTDIGLHIVAAVVLVGVIVAVVAAFWKLHELPIQKAHESGHRQLGLITILTWIGFVWHWVWVLAIIVAFLDAEKAIIRLRDIWRHGTLDEPQKTSVQQRQSIGSHPEGDKSC
ncbi:MFS transporter [Motilimonas pumila]|uniref:MFS transporter n=1 Tax=Motilimonas pumila TaxID=2303987 RepID=A0A418YHW1_9GAMM|nr:MFS transporter [Motilimonas pumila]RJG49909.1 MFS transporter [Motilimonas pumila]